MNKVLEKYDKEEPIQVGDLITYFPETDKVTRARTHWRTADNNRVIGVCSFINNNMITYKDIGIADVKVKGLVCLGDKLTASEEVGVAEAIKDRQDETKFRYRSIGKVIGLYNNYNIVKVLLDIE